MVLSIKIMFGTSENAHCFPMPLASIYTQPLRGFMHRKAIATKRLCTESIFQVHPIIRSSIHVGFSQRIQHFRIPKHISRNLGYPPFRSLPDCTMTSNTLVGKPALGSSICWTFSEPQTVGGHVNPQSVYNIKNKDMDVSMHGCIYLSIYLSIDLSVSLSVYLCMYGRSMYVCIDHFDW